MFILYFTKNLATKLLSQNGSQTIRKKNININDESFSVVCIGKDW